MKQVLFQNIIQSTNCFNLDRLIRTVPVHKLSEIFSKKIGTYYIQKPSSFMKDHIDVCNWTGVVHLYVGFLCQELREGSHGQGRPP